MNPSSSQLEGPFMPETTSKAGGGLVGPRAEMRSANCEALGCGGICRGPPGVVVGLDVEAELDGELLVAFVVVAPLPRVVLDVSGEGQRMGGFVEQGLQNPGPTHKEALAGDEDFPDIVASIDAPSTSGPVTPALGHRHLGARCKDHHHARKVRVVGLNAAPDFLEHTHRVRGGEGEVFERGVGF